MDGSRNLTGASKGTPGDAKCVPEILWRSWGSKFKFGHLTLRKIIKIVATRCHILRLKCTKFDFGWGFWGSSQRERRGRENGTGKERGASWLFLLGGGPPEISPPWSFVKVGAYGREQCRAFDACDPSTPSNFFPTCTYSIKRAKDALSRPGCGLSE